MCPHTALPTLNQGRKAIASNSFVQIFVFAITDFFFHVKKLKKEMFL